MAAVAPQQAPAVGFSNATRDNWQTLQALTYVQNTPAAVQLPQTGLLAEVGGIVTVTFTTAATGTYALSTTRTKQGGITPYGAINRIQLINNQSNYVYDTTAWGNYLWTRTLRETTDYRNPLTAFGAETTYPFWQPGTTFTTATQYTMVFPFRIPIALNESLQAGLLLAQNQYTRYQLVVQWGNIEANLLTLGGTTPSITVNSASCSPYVRYFNVPDDPRNWPNQAFVHQVTEDIQDIVGVGDNYYRPVVGPIYLSNMHELVNNGASVAYTGVNNVRKVYAASATPVNITPQQFLYNQFNMLSGMPLPQGCFWHNNKFGSGSLELASSRDFIDTSAITDFQYVYNLSSSLSLTSAYLRSIREMFFPNV